MCMGLTDLLKKKKAKKGEASIGKELEHLHPHIQKRGSAYKKWVNNKENSKARLPRGRGPDLISAHTTSNPLTGLQGTSDMMAMRRIKRRRPLK